MSIAARIAGMRPVALRQTVAAVILSASDLGPALSREPIFRYLLFGAIPSLGRRVNGMCVRATRGPNH